MAVNKHFHLYYCAWLNESRAWKMGQTALRYGLANLVFYFGYKVEGLSECENFADNQYIRRIGPTPLEQNNSSWMRVVSLPLWWLACLKKITPSSQDIIVAHSLAALLAGVFLKKKSGARLIYDAHELETERAGWFWLLRRLAKLFEWILIKYCDQVIVVSESIADWYSKEYRIQRPTVVLNSPRYRERLSRDYFRKELAIRDDQRIFLYQGALGSGRGILQLLEAFKVRTDSNSVIIFMGYGPLRSEIIQASIKYPNIFFSPAVSPDLVLEFTASADIGISLIENICLSYYYCLPNKLFEYAMAGLPVLVSNMKDMSELVQKNIMGSVIEKFSTESINQAIDNLLTADLEMLGDNAYKMACDHAWEKQEAALLSAYTFVIS